MILITGPLYSGKRQVALQLLGCREEELQNRCICDAHKLAADREDLETLADELAHYDAVTAAELGCGIIPADPAECSLRERAGRLSCLLAERADTVVRVFCGIPKVLKGEIR